VLNREKTHVQPGDRTTETFRGRADAIQIAIELSGPANGG